MSMTITTVVTHMVTPRNIVTNMITVTRTVTVMITPMFTLMVTPMITDMITLMTMPTVKRKLTFNVAQMINIKRLERPDFVLKEIIIKNSP